MPWPPRFVSVFLSLVTCFNAGALELRTYDAAVHDRFVDFPSNPSFNPSFLLEAERHAGVGWGSEDIHKQFALVSRCHVLFAAHNAPAVGSRISFLNTSGSIIERTVSRTQAVTNPTKSTSDVLLVTLSSPIDEDDGVAPLPYLDLDSEEDYRNLPLIVLGSQAKAGEGELVDFRTINVNWIVSRTYRFDYSSSGGDSDDARFAGGDSGSPSLVTVDGVTTLLGVHLATSTSDGVQSNYDAFIPHYVDQIDEIIAAEGFRMRPLNGLATELSCPSWKLSSKPVTGKPLELEFDLMNSGENPTGNLEVEIRFAEGTGPDQIAAEGWIVSGAGSEWILRRALLEEGASSTIRVNWSVAPMVETIEPEIQWASDSSPEGFREESVSLAQGYPSWASGLEEGEAFDDPDRDGLPNLIEYAFGSDPLVGGTDPSNFVPPPPSFTIHEGIAVYQHPERTDMDARGLSYTAEWSDDLGSGSWIRTAPAGFSSSTRPYVPGIPGFRERVISWPVADRCRFIRLDITD